MRPAAIAAGLCLIFGGCGSGSGGREAVAAGSVSVRVRVPPGSAQAIALFGNYAAWSHAPPGRTEADRAVVANLGTRRTTAIPRHDPGATASLGTRGQSGRCLLDQRTRRRVLSSRRAGGARRGGRRGVRGFPAAAR